MKEFLNNNLISIVMRTAGGRPYQIRRAIRSVAENDKCPLELIVIYQGIDANYKNYLIQLLSEFPTLQSRIIDNTSAVDSRAENLNIGWEFAKGRYIAFLDDDDSLEKNHFTVLFNALEKSRLAWAYSQALLIKEDDNLNAISVTQHFKRNKFSLRALWDENFLPIHSFLIDRSNIHNDLRIRPFCEELDRSEDWDFILRLAFWHEPAFVDKYTANYHVRIGINNTNLSVMSVDSENEDVKINREAWNRCKTLVEKRKKEIISKIWWSHEYFNVYETIPDCVNQVSNYNQIRYFFKHTFTRIIRKIIRILECLL